MHSTRQAYRFRVVRSYLLVAFVYLAVFLPIYLLDSDSLLLQAVHLVDLVVSVWAYYYLEKTKDVEAPALALCVIAYITVVAVMVTGGYSNSGPFLVFPYVPFVAFISGDRQKSFRWLVAMFLTMTVLLWLGHGSILTPVIPTVTFAFYIFMYLLTIMLFTAYMKEKELADIEVSLTAAELNRKNKLLRQLNLAKDNFIMLASHQLRTPASGVKQYLGMLLQGYAGPLSDRQREFTKIGYESNERQLRIVDDLLLVARVDAGRIRLKKRPTDLATLLRDIVSDQQATFDNRDQTLTQSYPEQIPLIYADPERLRMAIENITDNASKYTPPGRGITVEIKVRSAEVSILIKDEGVGISKEDRAKLFKKFSRLDNPLSIEVGGTGLGLYWAKKVVELHKGKLLLRSVVGKGSTFEVRLPKK